MRLNLWPIPIAQGENQMSDYEFIRYEPVEDSDVVVITLNRPEKLNAISSPLAAELADAFHRFDAGSAFVAVLAGAGRAFTAGMDVLENMAAGRTVMASPDLGAAYNPFHPGQAVDDGSPGPGGPSRPDIEETGHCRRARIRVWRRFHHGHGRGSVRGGGIGRL